VTTDDEIAALLRAGETHAEIARRLRISSRRVATVTQARGLSRKRGPRGAVLARQIDEMLIQGEAPRAISAELGCSRAYVYKRRISVDAGGAEE